MTTHRSTNADRVLRDLFEDLADPRTPAYLEAAIERASSRPQRPAWTYPGRWLPMQITMPAAAAARLPWREIRVLALVALLIAVAAIAYVGSQRRLPAPFGPAANGLIAVAKDGDIFVADRPGGALRPLVAGPEDDRGPSFSRDGTRLAWSRADTRNTGRGDLVMLADADGTNLVEVLPQSLGLTYASLDPDFRSIVGFSTTDGAVVIRPLDPAAAPIVLDIRMGGWGEVLDAGAPSFRPSNPDEILVVGRRAGGGPRGIYVYDLATGTIRTIWEPRGDEYVQDVEWLPDGEHILYGVGLEPHIVAADGSADRVVHALRNRISTVSNDGTRVVIDVEVADVPGDDSNQRSLVVPIDGDGKSVELDCGLGRPIACAGSWTWSPDDSMLIGNEFVPNEGPSRYLLADATTGRVTILGWSDVGSPAWQRVAQ